VDCVPRWELVGTGGPVTLDGVRVEPGDWVVADHDGIVVVPAAACADVLAAAEAKVATESDIRRAVGQGTPPLAAYERFGTF
jgi:regulator of RNase E activity RraA